jgi:hypothetical protein
MAIWEAIFPIWNAFEIRQFTTQHLWVATLSERLYIVSIHRHSLRAWPLLHIRCCKHLPVLRCTIRSQKSGLSSAPDVVGSHGCFRWWHLQLPSLSGNSRHQNPSYMQYPPQKHSNT